MARFKKPTKAEVSERRRALAERARSGGLLLPRAVLEMRHALGLTQDEFAAMLRLGKRNLAEIERGEANPTVETLDRIGRIFGFQLAFVAKGSDSPKPSAGGTDQPARD